ncbi:MAG: MBL fold metallo-hydrolase [Tuberibacillus sp.]
MKPVIVAEGVSCVTVPTPFAVGPVNIYIVQSGNKTLMIDAGPKTDEAWLELQSAFAELGVDGENLDAIVLTHHHPDHTGLINYLNRDIPLYGHRRLKPWLMHDEEFADRFKNYFRSLSIKMGVPKEFLNRTPAVDDYLKYGGTGHIHTFLDEGARIPGFEEWKAYYTPGHARSHISLLRDDGVLIAGDVLLEHISSNAIIEPPYDDKDEAPHTLLQYRESLKKCIGLPIKKVLPGHGAAYDFHIELVNQKLREQEKRRDDILHLIKDGKQTALEIGMTMFKHSWRHQLDLVLSEVQGHLDWLRVEGMVRVEEMNGVWKYHEL